MKTPFIETNCTLTHQGKTFESGGAVVTDSYLIGYLKLNMPEELIGSGGRITDWHGNDLGFCRIVSKWRTPRSFLSSHCLQVECIVNGKTYTGRSGGNGMIFKGKAKKSSK